MHALRALLLGAASSFEIASYGPGKTDVVEVGTDAIFVEFDAEAVICDVAPADALCVSAHAGDARRCVGADAFATDGKRATAAISPLDAFDTSYAVQLAAGVACAANGSSTEANAALAWTARTVPAPDVDDAAASANTTVEVDEIEVFGVGVFVDDVASIDLAAGTFYGDVDVFVLKYYRSFLDAGTALKEATRATSKGRVCTVDANADRWLFLAPDAVPAIEYVNGGKFRQLDVETAPNDGNEVLDHYRVRTEFYFEPTLAKYPFQQQTLPVTLELNSDARAPRPSRLLCLLEPYTGFAPKLSSFSSTENDRDTLRATAVVDEAPRRPPFATACRDQLNYPSKAAAENCPPTRWTSRLSLRVAFQPPRRLGALVLLPPALIACGSLVSYVLEDPALRLQTLATSTLAAVVQHASIRAALPPRSVATIADDYAFCVYAVIFVALLATLIVMVRPDLRKDALCAGPASALVFFHARRPAGLDFSWPTTLAFVAVGTLALLAARRGLLAAAHAAPGPAYAPVAVPPDIPSPRRLRERLLSDASDDYNLRLPSDDLEMVAVDGGGDEERGGSGFV